MCWWGRRHSFPLYCCAPSCLCLFGVGGVIEISIGPFCLMSALSYLLPLTCVCLSVKFAPSLYCALPQFPHWRRREENGDQGQSTTRPNRMSAPALLSSMNGMSPGWVLVSVRRSPCIFFSLASAEDTAFVTWLSFSTPFFDQTSVVSFPSQGYFRQLETLPQCLSSSPTRILWDR